MFSVFTLPIISGDPKTALKEPNAVVITKSMATKYFDKINPVGKVLRFDNKNDYKVTGVIKDKFKKVN